MIKFIVIWCCCGRLVMCSGWILFEDIDDFGKSVIVRLFFIVV